MTNKKNNYDNPSERFMDIVESIQSSLKRGPNKKKGEEAAATA